MGPDRKIFKYGPLLAAPAILLGIACGVDGKKSSPPQVPTTSDQNRGEILGAQVTPKNQIAIPSLTPLSEQFDNGDQITKSGEKLINDGIYSYYLYTQMTLDEITAASILQNQKTSNNATLPTDVKNHLDLAKQKEAQNPQDIQIHNELYQASVWLDAYCNGAEAKELMKRIASYTKINFPNEYSSDVALYYGRCYWGQYSKVDPETFATREPTVPAPAENPTPEIDSFGNLIFKERGYKEYRPFRTDTDYRLSEGYSLYQTMNLDKLLAPGVLNRVSQLSPQAITATEQAIADIRSALKSAKTIEQLNPQSAETIKVVNYATNSLNANCNNILLAKGYMKGLASYVYHKSPQDWPNNKARFLDGACFWGEKFIVSQEHEIINLDHGLFLYKGIGYNDLLASKNLDKLQPLYVKPDSFNNLKNAITTARSLDPTNPNDPKLTDSLLGAADYVANKCSQSAEAREYMRLLLSLVYEKHPNIWSHIVIYASDCDLLDYKIPSN